MIWEWDGKRSESCVVFFRVKEQWGGLSNMSNEFPLVIGEIAVKSSEALYQALRFPHRPEWQREILEAPHAMAAKMKAKKEGRRRDHSRADWDEIQVKVMEWCLRVKLAQHYQAFFVRLLRWSGGSAVVEQSSKDRFWGAVREQDGVLRGENRLGRSLGQLRDEAVALASRNEQSRLLRVEPLEIPDFQLLGKPIKVVEPAPPPKVLGPRRPNQFISNPRIGSRRAVGRPS